MDKIEQLRSKLLIDKHNLDDELIHQPMLLFEVSDGAIEASAERDLRKEELAMVDARLDTEVRRDLSISGEKFTEAMVKSGVLLHKDHQAASDAFYAAKERADTLGALKEAFQQRGYMLRDLASLAVANYYEYSSVQGTSSTDTSAYIKNRQKHAEKRRVG